MSEVRSAENGEEEEKIMKEHLVGRLNSASYGDNERISLAIRGQTKQSGHHYLRLANLGVPPTFGKGLLRFT